MKYGQVWERPGGEIVMLIRARSNFLANPDPYWEAFVLSTPFAGYGPISNWNMAPRWGWRQLV